VIRQGLQKKASIENKFALKIIDENGMIITLVNSKI